MISRVWEATTAKRMQIDPYCQHRKCSLVNVVSSNIRVMQIFAGVREIWGIKQESGRLRWRFWYLLLAIFSESSSPRLISTTYSICVKLLHKHDKLRQCCRVFTLALARLSCITSYESRFVQLLMSSNHIRLGLPCTDYCLNTLEFSFKNLQRIDNFKVDNQKFSLE